MFHASGSNPQTRLVAYVGLALRAVPPALSPSANCVSGLNTASRSALALKKT